MLVLPASYEQTMVNQPHLLVFSIGSCHLQQQALTQARKECKHNRRRMCSPSTHTLTLEGLIGPYV